MSSKQLIARVNSAKYVTVATLTGHSLRFHKYSNKFGRSLKADAYKTGVEKDVVIGVVFQINGFAIALDRYEGAGCKRKQVVLNTAEGESLEAMTYYADASKIKKDSTLKPFCWYLQDVLDGAREFGLPESYISRYIENIACTRKQNKVNWKFRGLPPAIVDAFKALGGKASTNNIAEYILTNETYDLESRGSHHRSHGPEAVVHYFILNRLESHKNAHKEFGNSPRFRKLPDGYEMIE